MTRIQAPRGTRDLFGQEVRRFADIDAAARRRMAAYGYEELRTPVFEAADLFSRAMGQATDVVEKEMFRFEDRGGRALALRPEGTAGVVRAYLEHHWDQGAFQKVYYAGPMFRAERPQAGRFREFTQIGAEYFGNPSPEADLEALFLMRDILADAGLPARFTLNSLGDETCRPAYREALIQYLRGQELCENCRARLERNPLRALDCKADGPKLTDAPVMANFWCGPCRAHHDYVTQALAQANFAFEPAPRLVRGLDYYTRTVFEVTAQGLGSQDAVGAGGRYDGLVKALGGPDVPAVGFAFGVDRIAAALGDRATPPTLPRIFVAQAGESARTAAWRLAQELRAAAGWAVELASPAKSLKAQFRAADGWNADWVILVGEEELKRGQAVLKDLKHSRQEEVPLAGIVELLRAKGES